MTWTILAYLLLAAAALAYTVSNLMLSTGSMAAGAADGGLAGVLRNRAYLAGTLAQGAGLLLALGARRELPLLVVQSGMTASLALTAVAGALLGRWRLSAARAAGVAAVVAGLALAAAAGRPGHAADPGVLPLLVCLAAVVVSLLAVPDGGLAAIGVPPGLRPAVRGVACGVGFGASAIGARVAVGSILGERAELRDVVPLVTSGTGLLSLALLGGGLVAGQVLLTSALASGAVTGPVAAMHVVENAAPAVVGVAVLGDVVAPGSGWTAALGVALAVAGSIVLAGHDEAREPQYR